jgi:hypothetical protein
MKAGHGNLVAATTARWREDIQTVTGQQALARDVTVFPPRGLPSWRGERACNEEGK